MVEESLYRRSVYYRAMKRVGNKYALVNVIAKRAHELGGGAPPMVRTNSKDPHVIAAEEIAAGKLRIVQPRPDEHEDEIA